MTAFHFKPDRIPLLPPARKNPNNSGPHRFSVSLHITKRQEKHEKSTDINHPTARAGFQTQDLQEERTRHDVLPRRDKGGGLAQLPALDKELPADDAGTRIHGLRQEPPVPSEGRSGSDSEASGGTVLEVPAGCFSFDALNPLSRSVHFPPIFSRMI